MNQSNKSNTKYLGVLRYKDEFASQTELIATKFPPRWTTGTREERIANILLDLPEACFRSDGLLLDTLRKIHQAIRKHQEEEKEKADELEKRLEGDGVENKEPNQDNQTTNQKAE